MSKVDYLPTLEDASDALLPQQLEILRQQVINEGGDDATIQSRFNYAWGLIKSPEVNDERLGIKILTDIYKESPNRRRECLYYLTIGCYKVNEFTMAKRYVDALYEHEPNNKQVQMLKRMVEDKIQRETVKGIAIGAGVIAGVATVIGLMSRSRRR
ncbi:mitochondrial fission 1 protein [Monosporozyma unispora]|nr:mitochondrial membrane protein [Kazachstania unispora]